MDEGWMAKAGAVRADGAESMLELHRSQNAPRGRMLVNAPVLARFRRAAAGCGLGLALAVGAAFVPASAGTAPADGPAPESAQAPLVQDAASAPAALALAEARLDPDELLQFGAMRVQRWIVETVLKAAGATDVDPVYMMALADKESSFIPGNRASTSSAEGLFQFVTSTWLEMVDRFGARHGLEAEAEAVRVVGGKYVVDEDETRERILALRRDPYLSALMAGEMMKRDRARIEQRLGRPIGRSEFYLAHFLGADSAGKMMALMDDKPGQSAPKAFPAAAKANKSLFYAKAGKTTRKLSVAEVYGKIDGMMDSRLDRYRDVSAKMADATP